MSRVLTVYDRLLDAMAALAGCLLLAAAGAIVIDVILRNLGTGLGVPGVVELIEYDLYLIAFLAAPWTLRLGAHVVVEILTDQMSPRFSDIAKRLADLVGLLVSLVLVYAGSLATWKSMAGGRVVFKTFIFPEWILLAPLPFCALILIVEFSLRLAGCRQKVRPLQSSDGARQH